MLGLTGGNPINDRTWMLPLVGVFTAVLMTVAFYLALGRLPNPGFVISLMLVGIGGGLVIARLGRLGPFEGEFGSPWFESDLCASLGREVSRAARFQRELTIAVVRQRAGAAINWQTYMRTSDQVIGCRNGWFVLVMPETNKDGVEALINRTTLESDAHVQAVVMDPSAIHYKPERLGEALLRLVRDAPEPSEMPLVVRRDTDRLRWTG